MILRKFSLYLLLGLCVFVIDFILFFFPVLIFPNLSKYPEEYVSDSSPSDSLVSLPNASGVFEVVEIDPSGKKSELKSEENIFLNNLGSDSEPDYNNLYYIDFRAFIDNMFYGDLSIKGWDNWNKDTHYIQSYIVDVTDDLLVLNIIYPEGKSFSSQRKEVSTECTRENSVLASSKNFELLDTNIDVFFESKEGDGFFSYCLDDVCNIVGKSCILVKYEVQE